MVDTELEKLSDQLGQGCHHTAISEGNFANIWGDSDSVPEPLKRYTLFTDVLNTGVYSLFNRQDNYVLTCLTLIKTAYSRCTLPSLWPNRLTCRPYYCNAVGDNSRHDDFDDDDYGCYSDKTFEALDRMSRNCATAFGFNPQQRSGLVDPDTFAAECARAAELQLGVQEYPQRLDQLLEDFGRYHHCPELRVLLPYDSRLGGSLPAVLFGKILRCERIMFVQIL